MNTKIICYVQFHKTPCCKANCFFEYPRGVGDDEECTVHVQCNACHTHYDVILTEFRKGRPRKARWYPKAEPAEIERAAQQHKEGEP